MGYLQVSTGSTGYLQVSTGSTGYLQVSTGSTGYLQVSTGIIGYLQVSTGCTGYLQVCTGIIGYLQVSTGSTGYLQVVKQFVLYESSSCFSGEVCLNPELVETLQANGLQFTPIPGDGDCFFKAIAANIRQCPEHWQLALNNIGINETDLPTALRQIMVDELLGHRRQEYEDFLSPLVSNYEESVKSFLDPSFFNSPIGNAMPLALARALQCSIVIFSVDNSQPTRFISPVNVECSATAFVVYNPHELGHYDAALPIIHQRTHATETPIARKAMSCRCGTNKKSSEPRNHPSCTDNPFYRSRCKCLKHKQPCNTICQCSGCKNPHGHRPSKSSIKNISTRKCRKHEFQVKIPQSRFFAELKGEKIAKGNWSQFETIILYEISAIIDPRNIQEITKLYQDIYDYSRSPYCTIKLPSSVVFGNKTKKEINSKIAHEKLSTIVEKDN